MLARQGSLRCAALLSGGRTKFIFIICLMFPESNHFKKHNGSCFMYLSEILSKLRMCKVINVMTFSDGLLIIYVNLLINHAH